MMVPVTLPPMKMPASALPNADGPKDIGADEAMEDRIVVGLADDGNAVGAIGGDGILGTTDGCWPPMKLSWAVPSISTPLAPLGMAAVPLVFKPMMACSTCTPEASPEM